MRRTLRLAVFAAAACLTSHVGAATPSVAPTTPAQPADVLAELLLPAAQQSPAAALPNCGFYDGQACSTPGHTLRCQWAPFEPGLCFCTTALVWTCG